jgi:yeast amino acid transporter
MPHRRLLTVLSQHRLEDVKMYGSVSEAQAASYDRSHPRYPYKSHGQWLKACYGLVACVILVIFNGVPSFLEEPFNVHTFIASYISVSPSIRASISP